MADVPPIDYDLTQLREWLSPRLHGPNGATCPCCGQHAQAYKRAPSAEMVRTMARMLASQSQLEAQRHGWVYLPDIDQRTRDVATLQYWGLIRQDANDRGWWTVTDVGAAFLRGAKRIQNFAHIYNGKLRGFSGPQITVYDVEPKFNLDALMKGE